MSTRTRRRTITGALVTAGALALSSGVAFAAPTGATGTSGATGATGATGSSFSTLQAKLESELASRVTQLTTLSSDVTGATTLVPAHATVLATRIATEQTSINALVAKVPTDTTRAELNADRAAMVQQNRVFLVMTPQVFETISADAATAEFTTLAGNEAHLATEVASLVGEPGYANALNHDHSYLARVGRATASLGTVVTEILAQTPSGYEHATHFFVDANHTILTASVQAAYASYDASVIALASGGYTGS
jgi:hypothetical protein